MKYRLLDPFSDLKDTVVGEPTNLDFTMRLYMNLKFENDCDG